jgi:hypothetical protein
VMCYDDGRAGGAALSRKFYKILTHHYGTVE